MSFHPGTPLGVFVIEPAGDDLALFDVIEGPQSDEVTLNCTYLSDERPSGFTFSVVTPLLQQITEAYSGDPQQRAALDALGNDGAWLQLTVDEQSAIARVANDLYGRGHALVTVRDERSGEQLARVAAIRGTEGFAWVAVAIVVLGVTYIVTRHRENMAAIEKCVPLDNQMAVAVTTPDGTTVSFKAGTRVHKTAERTGD